MKHLLRAELYQLVRMKSFWGILASSAVLGNILSLDQGLPSTVGEGISFSLYHVPILYFLILIFGALYLGGDFENRTLHTLISAGHGRGTILGTKVLVFLGASALILLSPLVFSAGIHTARLGLFEFSVLEAVKMLFLLVIMIFAMGMLPVLAVVVFEDVGKTLGVTMFCYFVMIFLLNTKQFAFFSRWLPMGQIRLLSLGQAGNQLLSMGLWDVGASAVLFGLSMAVFWKSDFR